jgi:hypothetical protein
MDGSTIDIFLPVFRISIIGIREIPQSGELQALVPAMSKECASPMCTLLFPCMLL